MNKSSLRIMFVFSTRAMGGMELRAARLAKLTMERGHSVYFGCPRESQLDSLLKEYNVARISLHIHGSLDVVGARKLAAYLRGNRIDLVMPFSGNDYWMTILAGKLSGARVVVNRSTPSALNPLSIPVLRRADVIIAVSKGIEDLLVSQGIPTDRITVVYLGVDTSLFSPESTSPREQVRKALGLPLDKFVIGCLSRPGKGQEDLLKAGSQLASTHPDVHYLFAGGGVPLSLDPLIHDFPHLQNRVILRDRLPHGEMADILEALDVFVLLPETEPFSNAVLEAMAMEKPVVVTRTQGNIEAIEDGKSGLLVRPHDIAAVIKHLGDLHDSPERRLTMGQHARQRVLRFFTQDIMMNRMEEVWMSVLPKT
ncbi:MAG: glycosyltransferase family 4 protein [Deltaproteobacteria bacterium]|nr:glycosyltransferase family 4 protein [Deltaproteobacteria bacterium]